MSKGVKIFGGLIVVVIGLVVAAVAILMSMDFNQYKGEIAAQVKSVTGRDLAIKGDLNLEISLNPAIAVDGVSFANASWGSKPEMLSVDRFAAEVSLMPLLSGTVDVKRVVLEGVTVLAETDKSGKGNWVFGDAAGETEKTETGEGGALPVVRMVAIKDVNVTYSDGVTGQTYDLTLDSVDLQADGPDAPLNTAIAGSINGQPFKVAGNLGTINALAAGGMIPMKLDVEALATKIGLDGQAGMAAGGPNANLKLTVGVANVAETLKAAEAVAPQAAGVELPPIGAVNLASTVAYQGNTLNLSDPTLKAGSLDLKGNLAVGLGGQRPSVKGNLNAGTVNVDEFMPKKEGEEKAAPAAPAADEKDGEKRVFSADPLPLDGLKAADVDMKIAAEKIIAQGIEATGVSVALVLKKGRLDVKPMKAKVFDGDITANISLDGSASTPSLKAVFGVAQLDYDKALISQGLKDTARGKVDVDVDVSGRGGSVRQLMAGLNGKARIVTKDGRIESNALNIVSTDLLNVFDSADDKTLKCGVVHFDVKNGMADARAIVIETGGISVVGTGSVDLKDEKPKLRVEPRAKKANIASAAMVPVNIKGTLAEPDWELDAAAVAGNVASGAARVCAAVATGGLSLLGEKLLSAGKEAAGAVDENDYCTPALAGKKVVPGEMKTAEKAEEPVSSGDDQPAASGGEPAKKEEGTLDSLGKGLGSGLKNLFGN